MFNITAGGDQFVTIAQAAALLGVTVARVHELVELKEVSTLTLIHATSLRSWLAISAADVADGAA